MNTARATMAVVRWWNPRVPTRTMGWVCVAAPAAAALDVVHHWSWRRHGHAPAVLVGVFGPAGRSALPRLGEHGFAAVGATVIAAALVATMMSVPRHDRDVVAAGSVIAGRATLTVVTLAYWWWAAETARYGTPTHARTALVVTLAALTLRERATGPSTSAWPLRISAVVLAYLYLTAGIEKLRVAGMGWWRGGATEAGIVVWGPAWARSLALSHSSWIHVASLVTLVLEIVAPVPLLAVASWRRPALVLAAGFHLSVYLLMGIDFLPMAAVCLLVAAEHGHGHGSAAEMPAPCSPSAVGPKGDLGVSLACVRSAACLADH